MVNPEQVVEAALANVMGACDCGECASVIVEALRESGHLVKPKRFEITIYPREPERVIVPVRGRCPRCGY